MKGLDLSGHYALKTSDAITRICEPLRKFKITYFMYIKIFPDRSREILTTHADWLNYFYQNNFYLSPRVIDLEYQLPKGYFLWSELSFDDPVYKQAKKLFNIDNGITFINRCSKYTLLYIFGSTPNNPSANQFYFRNIDLLKRFILYFNEKASKYITESKLHRIYLPVKQTITSNNRVLRQRRVFENKKNEFKKKTQIKRIYLFDNKNVFITPREAEYALHLVNGESEQAIAQTFDISFHTTRTFTKLLKRKLHCKRKSEITKHLKDLALFDTIIDIVKDSQELISEFS